jgi:hypothetical protein
MEAVEHLRARLMGADEPVPGRGVPVVPKLPRRTAPADLLVAPLAVRDVPDASL